MARLALTLALVIALGAALTPVIISLAALQGLYYLAANDAAGMAATRRALSEARQIWRDEIAGAVSALRAAWIGEAA